MLAEERFALILEQLNEKRTVTVQQLCEALHTSESTIRRDLTELDRQGRLTKVHGGATLPDSRFLADEPTMEAKETLAVAEKRSIAAAAAALITADASFRSRTVTRSVCRAPQAAISEVSPSLARVLTGQVEKSAV